MEANETEATVYATVVVKAETLVPETIPQDSKVTFIYFGRMITDDISPFPTATAWYENDYTYKSIKASSEPVSGAGIYTYNGKTVYYTTFRHAALGGITDLNPNFPNHSLYSESAIAWSMIYGIEEDETKTMLVGRFAIEIDDAGGVGPGSDWIDPGDYDPDWEPDDPTHTLYVTITGALSGRHNDPIEDPSYSYIPADKDAVKDYGCGGDGGHGGGGGAGASTVVVHKFATNQANSKEVTAIARRHGYGSGGGKGGKGGDGCILVYY